MTTGFPKATLKSTPVRSSKMRNRGLSEKILGRQTFELAVVGPTSRSQIPLNDDEAIMVWYRFATQKGEPVVWKTWVRGCHRRFPRSFSSSSCAFWKSSLQPGWLLVTIAPSVATRYGSVHRFVARSVISLLKMVLGRASAQASLA